MDQQVKESFLKEFKLESEEFNSRAEKFKLIFNASPDMIFILGHNGLVLDANQAALDIYEYDGSDVFGLNFVELLANTELEKNATKLFNSAQRGGEIDYEWLTKTKTGKIIPTEIRLRSLKLTKEETFSTVVLILRDISLKQKADEAIHSLARATNLLKFNEFLNESVKALANIYGTKFVFIGRLLEDKKNIQTLSVLAGGHLVENFVYALKDTPCDEVLNQKVNLIADSVCELYPKDELLIQMGIESYYGTSMIAEGKKVGLVVLLHDKPLIIEEWAEPILELFANRLAVEIERYDVTQKLKKNQEHLEELVRKRTQQIEEQAKDIAITNVALEEANKEMQSFCYSVSHDLRAPLRGISGFSDIVLEDYKDKLDEEGVDCLTRIKDSTVSMSSLIDGMLQLSRVSHYELNKFEEINISVLVEEILVSMTSAETGRDVKFTIQENLVINGERGLIIILLQNLIGNAWKYTSKSKSAHIRLFSEYIDEKEVYVIKDNGAGFNMEHAAGLFEPYKRLHGVSEFPGSGIGLATVKKVIDMHGGKIWAESIVGEGASFYLCF